MIFVIYSRFSPTDNKFASCSDDGTVKIWDFYRCQEERVLRGSIVMFFSLENCHTLPNCSSFNTHITIVISCFCGETSSMA